MDVNFPFYGYLSILPMEVISKIVWGFQQNLPLSSLAVFVLGNAFIQLSYFHHAAQSHFFRSPHSILSLSPSKVSAGG